MSLHESVDAVDVTGMDEASNAFGIAAHEAELLLDLAEVAIRACLEGTRYPGVDTSTLPAALLRPCGAFVTLHVAGELNGCIGNLDSSDPLGSCVTELAIKAAFEDPRLPALRRIDLSQLHLEVSVLSARVPVPAGSRTELNDHLQPNVNGLVVRSERRQAVFLPTVWEHLPHPDDFVDQLFRKAGLPPGEWPHHLEAEIFTTASISRHLT